MTVLFALDQSVLRQFAISGKLDRVELLSRGHIHSTFVSTWEQGGRLSKYLHQRLNDTVFRDIAALMHNVAAVTGHLERHQRQGAHGFETLKLVPTVTGAPYLDGSSGYWRTYHFVDGTESFDRCLSENQAFEAARAFGAFQAQLIELDPSLLAETIPQFFSTPHRFRQLGEAVASDVAGRCEGVSTELEFVRERRNIVSVMDDCLRHGRFPLRIVHGDTKLNNVLFDRVTARARCIVDLDTCMPAYSLYDFGDLVRFTAATSAEDEPDLEQVGTNLDLYAALVSGYREGTASFLTPEEVRLMPFAARLVTLTIGMRFLTDYIMGDVYFNVTRTTHNLDRARVQFRMVELMEALLPDCLRA